MACNNLVLYYNPETGKICNTDLNSLSSDALRRNIAQVEYILYDKDEKIVGDVNILNNICNYESTPNVTNTIANICITIIKDTFVEKYSVINITKETRDSSGQVNQSSIRFLNLTSVEGNQTYTKLKWILPVDEQGKLLTRILVFYN
jgi:hypothetical protein